MSAARSFYFSYIYIYIFSSHSKRLPLFKNRKRRWIEDSDASIIDSFDGCSERIKVTRKTDVHVARDAFPRGCDRADGAVGCRGELRRPCRFPIKQMPAGNSSNPSSQPPSLPLSLSLRSTAEGESAERTCRAACEIRIEAGLLLMCTVYVRPTFRLSTKCVCICVACLYVLHARESLPRSFDTRV